MHGGDAGRRIVMDAQVDVYDGCPTCQLLLVLVESQMKEIRRLHAEVEMLRHAKDGGDAYRGEHSGEEARRMLQE
jgi:hypothetical protein